MRCGGEQLTLLYGIKAEPISPDWGRICNDCGVDVLALHEWYMVDDRIWPLDAEGGALCVGCLDVRLGRQLVPSDFTEAPVNAIEYGHSRRLRARLGGRKGMT